MIDRAALTKARLDERAVTIPGVGDVRVRALSTAEAYALKADRPNGEAEWTRQTLALGMVDPALTAEDVDAWMAAAPAGELDPVVNAILELSGLLPTSYKEAAKSFRGQPGEAPPVPPGSDPGDERGPAT